jgi:3-mercaptopyruvate sulfurtransferase SseA
MKPAISRQRFLPISWAISPTQTAHWSSPYRNLSNLPPPWGRWVWATTPAWFYTTRTVLRWIGFDRAALLDGGLAAWTAEGGSLSTESVSRPARTLTVKLRPELITDQDEVRASIGDESVNLIDSLPAPHYRGEWAMYDRPGHITGAWNVPVTSLFDESGHVAFRRIGQIPFTRRTKRVIRG